ncbi:MAG: carbamoyl phosphate synthase large subunit, partial [Polyangiales bacterium]
GPEMRSTGEVMGLGPSFPVAFHKAMLAAGTELPDQGTAFVSVKDSDKAAATEVARQLVAHGFRLVATRGTAKALARAGLHAATVHKVTDGERPHVVDVLREGGIHLVINTTQGAQAIRDSRSLRRQTLLSGVPYFTTMAAASAVAALQARRTQPLHVQALQEAQGPAAA